MGKHADAMKNRQAFRCSQDPNSGLFPVGVATEAQSSGGTYREITSGGTETPRQRRDTTAAERPRTTWTRVSYGNYAPQRPIERPIAEAWLW